MRIISQNGKFDLPYENLAIFVEYENVIARFENERYLLVSIQAKQRQLRLWKCLEKHGNLRLEFTIEILSFSFHRMMMKD